MEEFSKIGGILLLSALKFLIAPSTAVYAGYNLWYAVLITFTGGAIGFVIFYKFGRIIQQALKKLFNKKEEKRISKKKRLLVKLKAKYGFYGLVILTPCLLGIPLGAILASVYYSSRKSTIPVFLG